MESYSHPAMRKFVSLEIASADSLATFLPYFPRGVIEADTCRPEQLYTLVPGSLRPGSSGIASLESLSWAMRNLSVAPSTETFYIAADQTAIQREVIESVKSGRAFQPAFDQIKFRANLGKQFFYSSHVKELSTRTCPYRQVQGKEIGYHKDMRAIYSNALEKEQATAVQSYLINYMGFRYIEHKEIISLHVNDDDRMSHVISFINASGDLKVRKLKSRDAKLFTLTELGGRSMDLRFKLMGQYPYDEDSAAAQKLMALADSCSLLDGVLQMPRDMGLSLAILRHKSKEKLTGTFTGDDGGQVAVHVTISLVKSSADELGSGRDDGHHEIVIYIPALTEALNYKPASSLGTAELRQMTAIVQFFQQLESALLGSQRGAGKY